MAFIQERVDKMRAAGIPEGALQVTLPAFADSRGRLHAAAQCELSRSHQPVRFSPAASSKEFCTCMSSRPVTAQFSSHWLSLMFFFEVVENLTEQHLESNAFAQTRWYHQTLSSTLDLPLALGGVEPSTLTEMTDFAASLCERIRVAGGALHDMLISEMPQWYEEYGLSAAALKDSPQYLVGLPEVFLWKMIPRDLHLYLLSFLSRDAFMDLRAQDRVTLVVQVPEALLEGIERHVLFNHGPSGTMTAPSTPEDTPAVLENLQGLWAPRSTGAMNSFSNAVAAARSL